MEDSRSHETATISMFDDAAERSAKQIDTHLAEGTYYRATTLVDAVRRVTPPGGRILDYGCGTGRISMLLAKEGFSVVGAEPSEASRLAMEQDVTGLSLRFLRISPSDTSSLVGELVNTILCSSVIEFVPDPTELLRKLRDLLVPDGRLVLSYANRTSAWRQYAQLRFGRTERHFLYQRHVWRESQSWAVLRDAGFDKAGPTRFFEAPYDEYWLMRSLSRSRFVGTLGLVVARKTEPREVR